MIRQLRVMWVTRLVGTTPVGPIVVDWGFHPSETDITFRLGKADSEQAEEKMHPAVRPLLLPDQVTEHKIETELR